MNDKFSLLRFCHAPGPTKVVLPIVLLPDTNAETPWKALWLQLLFRITEMRHKADM